MLGNGSAGLLWSYPFSRRDANNYKFLDFTGGVKPYLLKSVDNGIGLVTEIEYQSSTQQAISAEKRGYPWKTRLPFPVQVVSRIIQRDLISGAETARRILYYDGFFNGVEREFCGFGRVEVVEEGDSETPSTLTVSWFYQGHPISTPGETVELRAALRSRLYRLEVYETDNDSNPTILFRTEEDIYEVLELQVGY